MDGLEICRKRNHARIEGSRLPVFSLFFFFFFFFPYASERKIGNGRWKAPMTHTKPFPRRARCECG